MISGWVQKVAEHRETIQYCMCACLEFVFSFHACKNVVLYTRISGQKQDWQKLLAKIEKIPSFGAEPAQWYTLLKPVLSRFVTSFDQPDSQENKDFWQTIAHYQNNWTGKSYYAGWITAFLFFSKTGASLHTNTDGLLLDGVQFHRVETTDVPPSYAEVDVSLDDNGQTYNASLLAGMVAIRVLDSESFGSGAGEKQRQSVGGKCSDGQCCDAQNATSMLLDASRQGKSDVLQPVAGWWLFDKMSNEEFRMFIVKQTEEATKKRDTALCAANATSDACKHGQ